MKDRETEQLRDRDTERQRHRETETQRDRDTETQRDRDTEKDRGTENIKWHGGIRNTNARDNQMEQTILRKVSWLRYDLFVTRMNYCYRFPISI